MEVVHVKGNLLTMDQQVTMCSICCEDYNKSFRKAVTCPKCQKETCMACIKTYITTSAGLPNCMLCNAEWNFDTLYGIMTSAWITTVYKSERQKTLFQSELAKIPASQVYIDVWNRKVQLTRELNETRTHLKVLKTDREKMEHAIRDLDIELMKLRARSDEKSKRNDALDKIEQLKTELESVEQLIRVDLPITVNTLQNKIYDCIRQLRGETVGRFGRVISRITTDRQENEFKFSCPRETCRGFLDTLFICGVCRKETCDKCHELRDSGHVCDKNLVASIKFMKSDSKPCPKCGAVIHRIMGCNQMWCTHCHARFDWESGQIYKANEFHNPHYIEFLRRNDLAPEERLDRQRPERVVDSLNCEDRWNLIPMVRVLDILKNCDPPFTSIQQQCIVSVVHQLKEVCHTTLPKLMPTFLQAGSESPEGDPNLTLRLKYMIGDLTDDEFSLQLYQREYGVMMANEYRSVFDMYEQVTDDLLHSVVTFSQISYDAFVQEYDALIAFVNDTISDLNKKFKRKTIKLLECV